MTPQMAVRRYMNELWTIINSKTGWGKREIERAMQEAHIKFLEASYQKDATKENKATCQE